MELNPRHFSSTPTSVSTAITEPTATQPSLIHTEDGRQFAAFELPPVMKKKLKPYIVKRRLARMRTYLGTKKDIRGSPYRLNLVCQLAAGLYLPEALEQLAFTAKQQRGALVGAVLQRTANLADIRDNLQPSQLEVAECFATRGKPLKRLKIMGRGRSGRMEHKFGHLRVVLREVDFKLRIYQAPTMNQKKKWFVRQQRAEQEYAEKQKAREELEQLERQAAELETKDT